MQLPHRGRYLIRGGTVVSVDPDIGIVPAGQLLVDDGVIVDVGAEVNGAGAEVVEAADMIIMPGLIDTHFHMWSSIGRSFIGDGYGYFPAKWDTAEHYEASDYHASVLLGSVEALSAGITTVHNWSHNILGPAHADAELRAHRDSGVRARYSYGHRDALPRDVALDFGDIDRVRREWFGADSPLDGLVDLGVNLRGPERGNRDVFDHEMADAHERGLPVSMHAEQGGSSRVDAVEFEERGYLGPEFLICHYLPARDVDMRAMARTGTPLSYAMHSELRLAVAGDARDALLRFRDSGVTVSLSLDATSISPVDLFSSMNVAWGMGIPWEGTRTSTSPELTFTECIEMATINGARALRIDDRTGSLTPGKRADVIMVRTTDLNIAPVTDVEATIVRSTTPFNVDTVIIDGRILKRGGGLIAHDVDEIVRSATRAALGVRKRASVPRLAVR